MSLWELFFGFSDATKARHPHVFVDYNIDRHKCHRVLPMKVLSLGMGRTGTASMKVALDKLGYTTGHGFDLHSNPRDGEMWAEAYNAKYFGDTSIKLDSDFWDKLLGHVSAICDTPANCFGPELIKAYPDTKIILVERDIDKWYPSFERALIQSNDHPWMFAFFALFSQDMRRLGPISQGMMRGQFRAANPTEWRQNAKPIYKEHYAEIREVLKDQPERLLEYKLGSGWGPLCEFLDQPIPEGEFPYVNEAKQHDEMIAVVMVQLFREIVGKLMLYGAPLVGGLIAWRMWKR